MLDAAGMLRARHRLTTLTLLLGCRQTLLAAAAAVVSKPIAPAEQMGRTAICHRTLDVLGKLVCSTALAPKAHQMVCLQGLREKLSTGDARMTAALSKRLVQLETDLQLPPVRSANLLLQQLPWYISRVLHPSGWCQEIWPVLRPRLHMLQTDVLV